MRRRAADYRRPVRRRFSDWIWVLLGLFLFVGLVLFVLHHNQHEDRGDKIVQDFKFVDLLNFCYTYVLRNWLHFIIDFVVFVAEDWMSLSMLSFPKKGSGDTCDDVLLSL
ncbi:hypothetical protein Patl1_18943 [Pistacia atlantica]|uniref:Uncharacterized protein n=1 Tax=Pistacia atlantica TaxID=434234 RepID=A0ACC1BXB7_9ROSI|nr:hypothetical protein Patl1_18943 [Pistacia atlantica]